MQRIVKAASHRHFFATKAWIFPNRWSLASAAAFFFGYLPFLKAAGMRVSTFRSQPGAIFRKVARRLDGDFVVKTYRNPQKGMDELRRVLKTGQIVGLKTNLYWLPYFSERFRFNFSGHNLIVLRETKEGFRISDRHSSIRSIARRPIWNGRVSRAVPWNRTGICIISNPSIHILICGKPASRG
jgi:hypothetical protein